VFNIWFAGNPGLHCSVGIRFCYFEKLEYPGHRNQLVNLPVHTWGLCLPAFVATGKIQWKASWYCRKFCSLDQNCPPSVHCCVHTIVHSAQIHTAEPKGMFNYIIAWCLVPVKAHCDAYRTPLYPAIRNRPLRYSRWWLIHSWIQSLVFGSPVTRPEKDRNQTGPRPQKDQTTGPVFSFLRCKDHKKTGLSKPVLTGLNRSFVAPQIPFKTHLSTYYSVKDWQRYD